MAIRMGAWEQNSRVQFAMEGNRPHGHSDQGLRGFNVRAILRGIGGLDEGGHHKLAEAENHETNGQNARQGQPDQ